MFFQGSLQEGISTAVGQQKLVLCFVTDENEEGQTWENDFLPDSSLSELIRTQAIALRLLAGSEEAGYLSQIFPLPKAPTVVIMKHGELKEYITPGVNKEDFIRRVQTAFSATKEPSSSSTAQPAASAAAAASSSSSSSASQATPSESSEPQQSDSVRRILAERAARLAAHKEEAERKAKEDRAKAQERAKAEAEAGANTEAAKKHQQAEAAKKRKLQGREERERILKRIEADKEERKARAHERQQQRAGSLGAGDVAASLVDAPQTKIGSSSKIGDMASIQVRLFDGSSMRHRFKTAEAMSQVRNWIDKDRTDGNLPYTFRQVLTPLPNKAIDASEESKSLRDLELAPSATLVLVPVQKYSSAYRVGSGNILSQVAGLVYTFFLWLLSLVGIGRRRAGPEDEHHNSNEAESTARAQEKSRVRGFQNPNDRRRDQQLYNGNSLNFEPRPDEDEK